MSNPVLRVGGVPEHFNFPWQLAITHHLFADYEFDITWQDFPGGTGAMCQALRKDELDIAVVLTEGAVADIIAGNEARIIGTYVSSPLVWGIHVHNELGVLHPAALEDKKFAISRYGSGSHLMALVHGHQSGWDTQQMSFEVVGSYEGARVALEEAQADVFMWEKFTTKPTVDRGEWRRIGEVRTPWPCFVMMARADIFENYPQELEQLMYLIRRAQYLLPRPELLEYLTQRYQLRATDVEAWYAQTEWLIRPQVNADIMLNVQEALQRAGAIPQHMPIQDLVAPSCQISEENLTSIMYDWRVASTHKMLALWGKSTGPLSLEDLSELGHLDQYHYLGTETSHEVAELLNLTEQDYVCDLGSGVGGTARVMAHRSGCRVLGIELQADLNLLAEDLTRRTGLHDRVRYQTANLLQFQTDELFDHFIALLVFLHIDNRPAALAQSFKLLRPGGRFVIEDLVLRSDPLTGEEAFALRHSVSAPSVSGVEAYMDDLKAAGFVDLAILDMTALWRPWVAERYQQFAMKEDFNRSFFGEKIYNNRQYFYRTICDLFEGGNIGGVRITGRKPN